jgi:hypothetical protein
LLLVVEVLEAVDEVEVVVAEEGLAGRHGGAAVVGGVGDGLCGWREGALVFCLFS